MLLNRARSFKVASNASFSRLKLFVTNNRKSLSVWSTWRTWQKPVQPNTNGFHGNAAVWLSFNFLASTKNRLNAGHVQFRRLYVLKSVLESLLFSTIKTG